MFRLPNSCSYFTSWQSYAQNPSSYTSTVYEQRSLDVQAGFRKGRETVGQIANICWIIESKGVQTNIFFFIDHVKAFDCMDYNELWKIQNMSIPDYLTCLQISQEADQVVWYSHLWKIYTLFNFSLTPDPRDSICQEPRMLLIAVNQQGPPSHILPDKGFHECSDLQRVVKTKQKKPTNTVLVWLLICGR